MTAFTVLGVLVYLHWCFLAGYALGFALDVGSAIWSLGRGFKDLMPLVLAAAIQTQPQQGEGQP